MLTHIKRIQDGLETPAVMVLVVTTQASSPQVPGARMLVNRDGIIGGTVGGGTVEKLAVDHCLKMLDHSISTDFVSYDMNQGTPGTIATGMLCGGTISMFFERIESTARLIMYGCGHIGGILAPMAAQCGFRVLAIDQRPEMADPARFFSPVAEINVLCAHPVEHAATLSFQTSDSIVIMTHNHQFDAAVLKALTSRMTETTMPGYLGMIGSSRKVAVILEKLRQETIDETVLSRIRTPIGLKTGGDSPGEIAVSIMAEILAFKYGMVEEGRVRTMRFD